MNRREPVCAGMVDAVFSCTFGAIYRVPARIGRVEGVAGALRCTIAWGERGRRSLKLTGDGAWETRDVVS